MTQTKSHLHGGVKSLIDRLLAKNIETILAIPGSKLYRRFVRATKSTQDTQHMVLREILHYGADSVFGREHGFSDIADHDDYIRNVPVLEYEDLRSYIERHMRGEAGVLFPGKPLMYNRTSGTTAKAKYIPISPHAFNRTIKDRGKLWLYGLMRDFPGIYKGKDLTLVSPAVEGYTEDGTPYGSLSGLVYQNIPEFVKLVHTIPYSVMCIKDYNAKIYTLLRFALAHDVTIILTGNPSSVLNLVSKVDECKSELIRDIFDGTLKKDLNLTSALRQETEDLLRPDPERARFLDKLAATNNVLKPADYWPNLKLVNTWLNGNCGLLIPKLYTWFKPETPILDFGYIASEITATDLIDRDTSGSILQIQNGFFEFTRLEESDRLDRKYLLAHELEVGEQYFIYVTTFNGLYRYDMNDVLEVVGFFNTAPILRFLFKGKGITNITGEKLSEAQLIEAMHMASKRTGMAYDFFVGYADFENARYRLFIEFLGDYTDEHRSQFGMAVDEALGSVNVEYQAKRSSDRLKPLEVVPLAKGALERYRNLRMAEGAHDGQVKWMQLSATSATRDRLIQLSADNHIG